MFDIARSCVLYATCLALIWAIVAGYQGINRTAIIATADASPEAFDDTLECLQSSLPITRHQIDHGYTRFTARDSRPGVVFDLRGSLWYTEQFPRYLNNYPIVIVGAEGGCIVGGVIVGTTNPEADWRQRYGHIGESGGNSAGVLAKNVNSFSYSGVRMSNVWDGVRVNRHRSFFQLQNSWIDAADDCIENDGLISGIVNDNLFDGCFVFISNRPGRANSGDKEYPADSLVTISSNLIYSRAVSRDGMSRAVQNWAIMAA